MIRFLGEMQNTIDQMQKWRSNTEFMQGPRSTLFEKHGVLYTIYREALISKFQAIEDGENEGDTPGPGQYKADGLLKKMARFESAHGFSLPDPEKYPKGFVYIEEAGEGEEEQTSTEKTPDAMTKEDVQKFLESFNAKTTAPAWTVAFFCGFVQQNDFLKVIDSYCSGRAERFFWHKANVHMNPNKTVRFNDLECGVLGYHVKSDAAGGTFKKPQWMSNFELGDGERYSRASLIRGFLVVHQMFKRDGKVVNNHQKPQALLMELIQVHMLGDNPGKLDDDGHPLNWILDGCCGVGSTSMAAMRCGLNAIGFDHDPYMVSSAQQRLTNFDDKPDQNAETKPKENKKSTNKGKETATGNESEEEDVEEEAATA
eukprot:gene20532-biopygen21169